MRHGRWWCWAGILALGVGLAGTAWGQEGEDVKGGDLQDHPGTVSSPTVVDPLYQCGSDVAVRGAIRHAEITVYVNGGPQGSALVQFAETAVHLGTPLVAGDLVTATQKVDGVESEPSPPVEVRDHTIEFPDGLPQSAIFPAVAYECGLVIADLGHLPGSNVTVFRNDSGAGTWGTSTSWTNLGPAGGRFGIGEKLETQYEICGDISPMADEIRSIPQPATIPPPRFDPPETFEGQEVVNVTHLLEGALARLTVSGFEVGAGATAIDWLPFDAERGLGRPLAAGEMMSATQELCDISLPTPTVTVHPCSSLPAPRIAAPAIGDEVVRVIRSQPGARIHVFDASGMEIGDGAAPEVRLYRTLRGGDTIRVTQSFETCRGNVAYQIPIRCNPFDVVPDRSTTGDMVSMPFDYNEGTVVLGGVTTRMAATVRFPATPDQQLTPGLHPIAFVMHGNHGTGRRPGGGGDVCGDPGLPEAPSFRGYDFLLDALARQGYIAVSINVNDLNCMSGRIPERADLFREHMQLWQRAADPMNPSPPFGGLFRGGIDFGRVVLFGHSRGGDAAVMAGSRGLSGGVIRGVVAIAPTDAHGTVLDSVPLFVLAPANDLDVIGSDGVQIYDRARGPASWFRSYVYIHDANHNFFNREWGHDSCALGGSRMTRPVQEAFLRALGVEFADQVIGRPSRFRDVARERARVDGLSNSLAFWMYQRGDDVLIDDFQDGNASRNRLGDGVDFSGFARFEEKSFDKDAGAISTSFLHDTQGLLARWSTASQMTSKIPPGAISLDGRDTLSLRIAQVGAEGVPGASPFGANLSIRDRGGRGATLSIPTAARVPRFYTRDVFACGDPFERQKTVMTQVRVPLACFEEGKPLDLEDLSEVQLQSGAVSNAFIGIDDLGFSR